jgi:hypothetical protein
MLAQCRPVQDGFVDIDGVGRHDFGKRADQGERIDGFAAAVGLGFFRFESSGEGVVLARPMLATLFHGVGIDLAGAGGLRQRLQCGGDVAFEISVGMQVLVDHMTFELIVVDGDNLALGRPGVRRVPGRAAADQ